MKKWFILFAFLLAMTGLNAQTIVFQEDFEGATPAFTSSGTPSWSLNTRVFAGGAKCDSSSVGLMSTSYLTSNSFSTTGNTNVILEFKHICKIESQDSAKIYVSIDGGTTWTQVLASQYSGAGTMTNDRFSSQSYPTDWQVITPGALPSNTWWKPETFDISSIAGNQANVKVRFKLSDGNSNGNGGTAGWYIDDVKVTVSPSELIPPTITLLPTIYQDTINNTGPFTIKATITDASGLTSAVLQYSRNGGATSNITMTNTSGTTWEAVIPAQVYNSHIDYTITATDASLAANVATLTKWFYNKTAPADITIGTGTSTQYHPFNSLWGYGRSASLFTQAEINKFGTITTLAWDVSSASTTAVPSKIYIKTTTATTLSSDTWANLISGATLVYDASTTYSPTGYKTIDITDFAYNADNLVILCEANYGGSGASSYPSFKYSSATSKHEYFTQDNSAPTGSGTINANRPNIKIGFIATSNATDAKMNSIVSPTGIVMTTNPYNVTGTVKNLGSDTLKTATIKWTINGVAQTDYAWSGSVIQDQPSSTFTFGNNVNFNVGNNIIKAWTYMPNGAADQAPANDTITATVYGCSSMLHGTYTVDATLPTGGNNYQTMAEFMTGLNTCGIDGPVVVELMDATYSQNISFGNISGTSAANNITVKPGAGKTVTISTSSTSGVVNFTDSKYISIDGSNNGTTTRDLTIANTSTAGNSAGVLIGSSAAGAGSKHITVKNCNINTGSKTATTYGISVGGTTAGSNGNDNDTITLSNNNITKAYNGIFVNGASATNPGLCDKIIINDNIIGSATTADFIGNIGIQVSNITNSTIEKNKVFNIETTSSSLKGISISTGTINTKVSKNTISNIKYTGTSGYGGWGLYINTGNTTSNISISNNMISGMMGDGWTTITGTSMAGIVIDGTCGGFDIYNNTVNLYGNYSRSSATITADLFVNTSVTAINLRNNNFRNTLNNTGSTTAKSYTVYSLAAASIFTDINYNNYFVSGTQGKFGYIGSADVDDIAAWRTATTKDANSVSLNPFFVADDNLHTFTINLDSKATPIASITDDIDGEARNATTPDIGADEYDPIAIDALLYSIVKPSQSGCGLGTDTVRVKIVNFGTTIINGGLTARYKLAGSATTISEPVTAVINPLDTVTFTFATLIDFTNPASHDSTFHLKVWVDLVDDITKFNDTLSTSITSGFQPTPPTVTDATVNYMNSATLSATVAGSANIYWYTTLTSSSFFTGNSYTTPILTDTVTYYVAASTGTADLKFTEITQYSTGTGQTPTYPSYITGADLIEITNLGTAPADMTGYQVIIEGTGARTFTFPAVTVPGGGVLVLHAGTGTDDLSHLYLNMGGSVDAISSSSLTGYILKTPTNTIVDAVALNSYTFSGGSGVTASDWSGNIAGSSGLAGVVRIVSDNNNASDWSLSSTTTQTIGTMNTAFSVTAGGLGCASARVPVTAYVIIPDYEPELLSVLNPVGKFCSSGVDSVKIKIKNNGNLTISSGLTASYTVDGGAPVTENVTTAIGSGDTITFTFATPYHPVFVNGADTIDLDITVTLATDGYLLNNDYSAEVIFNESPASPVVANQTIDYATTATLTATSPLPIFWYSSPGATVPIASGANFTTPVLFANTVYYAEASGGFSGGVSTIGTGTLTQSYVPAYGWFDYSWSGSIYRGSEFTAYGKIDSIAYKVTNTPSNYTQNNQRVYFELTSDTAFATADFPDTTAMTRVFNGSVVWNGSGWHKIALTSPFNYDGTQNLKVVWINGDGSYSSGYPVFESSNAAGNVCIYDYQDSSLPTGAGSQSSTRPNTMFIASATGCPSPRVADTVFITNIPAQEAGVIDITSPVSAANMTNAETVIVTIKNFSNVAASNIPVKYSLDGGTVVSATYTGTINPGQTASYTFTATADFSTYGIHNLIAYTDFANDGYRPNDTTKKAIPNVPPTYCDSRATSTVDDDIENVTFANINNTSLPPFEGTYTDYRLTVAPAEVAPGDTIPMSVAVNFDAGSTYSGWCEAWIDFNNDGMFNDTTEVVLSGPYVDIDTVLSNVIIPQNAYIGITSMRVVIVESADSAEVTPCGTYSWGETEDYLVKIAPQYTNNVGVIAIVQPSVSVIQGSNVTIEVTIKNFGDADVSNIPVSYTLNGLVQANETFTGTIPSLGTANYTFTDTYVGPMTLHQICAKTNLVGDENTADDQTCVSIQSVVGIEDNYGNSLILLQNIPNPANEQTEIRFNLPNSGDCKIIIRNTVGQVIETIPVSAIQGLNKVMVNTNSYSAGVYYYTLEFENSNMTRMMNIAR